MPVSNAELRIMLNMQARGQEIAARVAKDVQSVKAAIDQVGQSKGFQQAQKDATALGSAMQKTAQQAQAVGKAITDAAKAAPMTQAVQGTKQMVSGLQQVAAGYQKVGQSAQQAQQAIARTSTVAASTAQQVNRVAQAAQQATRQLQQASAASGKGGGSSGGGGAGRIVVQAAQQASSVTASTLSNITAAFSAATRAAATGASGIAGAFRTIAGAAQSVAGGVAGGLNALVNGLRTLVGGVTGIAGHLTGIGQSSSGLTTAAQNVNTLNLSLSNLLKTAAAVTGLTSTITFLQGAFQAFMGAAVGFNSQLENAKVAFTSLLGSGEKAVAFMGQLKTLAENTPFEFPDLLIMSQQLIGAGFAAERVIPLLKDVAGAMTAAGRSSADIRGVARAFQQIFTTGKVQADEMNQLAERGIPGWDILGAAIRKTGESMESARARAIKLGEQGKISAEDFFAAFQQYSGTHGWREMAENAVNTFTGALSNLKDSTRFLIADATEPLFASLSAGIQNFSLLLRSDPIKQFALDIGATLREIIASLKPVGEAFMAAFNLNRTQGASAVQAAVSAIVDTFKGVGQDMFGAGYQIMVEYANGIMSAAGDAIQGAIDFVAELIASYLIGSSPPPQGPLSQITQGGTNVGLAWVEGLTQGLAGIEAAIVPIVDAFGNITNALSLGQVQGQMDAAAGNLSGLTAAAEEAEGALRGIGEAQRELDREQSDLTSQVESVKSSYEDQISVLKDASEEIKNQNQYANEMADLIDRQTDAIQKQTDIRNKAIDNEIRAAEIANEGDPVRRAELVRADAILKHKEKLLGLDEQEAKLTQDAKKDRDEQEKFNQDMAKWEKDRAAAKKAGKEFDRAKPKPPDRTMEAVEKRRADLVRERIGLERQEEALVDPVVDAQNKYNRSLLDSKEKVDTLSASIIDVRQETAANGREIQRIGQQILALPLDEQVAALEKAQKAQLKPLEQRLELLKQEERKLQDLQKEWAEIKKRIDDAVAAQKKADKDAKAGEGGGLFAGKPGGRPAGDTQAIVAGAEKIGKSMAEGIGKGIQDNLPAILGGVLGGIAGGALFGPAGFLAGTYFGAQVGVGVGVKLKEAGITDMLGDIGRTWGQALAGGWSVDHEGLWVSPLVDAVGRAGLAVSKAAEVIKRAWTALQGPFSQVASFIKEHIGVITAALAGMATPAALGGLISVGQTVFAPLLTILANLSPAMLIAGAAAVALKIAWDNAFIGIADTTEEKIQVILDKLAEWTGVDTTGITGQWEQFEAIVVGVLGNIDQWITDFIASVARMLGVEVVDGSKWDNLKAIAIETGRIISVTVDGILEILAGLFGVEVVDGSKWETFKAIAISAKDAIVGAADAILEGIRRLVGADLGATNWETFKNIVVTIKDDIVTAIGIIKEQWGTLVETWNTAQFQTTLQKIVDDLKTSFGLLWEELGKAATSIAGVNFTGVETGAGDADTKIRNLGQAVLGLTTTLSAFTGWVLTILDGLSTLGRVLDDFKVVFESTMDSIFGYFDSLNTLIKGMQTGNLGMMFEALDKYNKSKKDWGTAHEADQAMRDEIMGYIERTKAREKYQQDLKDANQRLVADQNRTADELAAAADRARIQEDRLLREETRSRQGGGDGKISDPRDAAGYTGPPAASIVATIIPDVPKEVAAATAAGEQIGAGITDGVTTGIQSGQQEAIDALEEYNQNLDDVFVNTWQIKSPSAVTFAYGVSIVEGLVGGISSKIAEILTPFTEAFDQITALMDSAWSTIQETVDTAMAGVESTMDTAWATMQSTVDTAMTTVGTVIQTGMTTVQTVMDTAWTTIQTVTTTALTTIQTTMDTAWTTISTAAETAWTLINTMIETVWTTIQATVDAALTALQAAIDTALETLTTAFQTTWDAILLAVQTWAEQFKTNVSTAITTTLAAITSTLEQWTAAGAQLGQSFMEALTTAITSAASSLASTVAGVAQQAWDGVKGMFNAGDVGGGGSVDPAKVAGLNFGINPGAGQTSVLQQWAPVLQAIEESGGPLARNIASIIMAENGAGNSDLVKNSKNWFSISRWGQSSFQSGTDQGGRFGAYPTDAASIADFLDLLNTPNYKEAKGAARGTAEEFIAALAKAHYIVPEPGYPVETWLKNTSAGAKTYDTATAGMKMPSMGNLGNKSAMPGTPLQRVQGIDMNQFNVGFLSAQDAAAACGPYMAWLFAKAAGRNPTPEEALDLAKKTGWTKGLGMGGAQNAADLVNKLIPGTGLTARVSPAGPGAAGVVDDALKRGSPVGISTTDHFFAARGGSAAGGLDVGKTGSLMPGGSANMTLAEIDKIGHGINGIIVLTGQMGAGFQAAGEQATTATGEMSTGVTTTGSTIETTAAAVQADATTLVSMSTDELGNVTRIYAEAGVAIGGSITDASGKVVNAWGTIATANQSAAASAEAANQQAMAFAATLTSGMVPAGAQAGTAIQMMTDNINPLLAEIAAGTLTTDQLVMKLGALALNSGLTSVPLQGMADKTMTAKDAMLLMLTEAAKVDPQFAILREGLIATDASAQTMAVTFAEGVANSTGVAGAALQQMATVVDPLIAAMDSGQLTGTALERTIVQVADAAGLATAPFREMKDGVIDSNQALKDVIELSAAASPEFDTLAKEVAAAGTVSQQAAKKYLELVKAFNSGTVAAGKAEQGAEDVAQTADAATAPFSELSSTISQQASAAMEAFQTTMTTGTSAAIEAVRGLSGNAESAGQEVGQALTRGLASGIESAAEEVANKAADVVRKAIEAAKSEANAHSPSEETKEIGFNLNAGLEVGQIEDSKYVEDAARGVIGAALGAMRDEADAHSPSGEGVRIGSDIMKGLVKGLKSTSLGDVARDQIKEYIQVAGNFSDQFAGQVGIGVAKLQHMIASEENSILSATMAVADAQAEVEKASKGTYEQQMQIATLTYLQAETSLRMSKYAEDDLNAQIALRQVQEAREKAAAGTLAEQMQLAAINQQILGISQQEAIEAQRSLGVRQELAAVEAEQAAAAKGSLADQIRTAQITQRTAELAAKEAAAAAEMLPLKNQIRDVQKEIEKATRGSVAAQQAAIEKESQQAALKIEMLQIQDKLANAEDTGGGMSQDEINALHERERILQQQMESAGRAAEIEKLQTTIATAGNRSALVALQDQLSTKEEGLLPVQDEKAMLEAEQAIIAANNAALAAGYGEQVVSLGDQVAQHDKIALDLENQKASLEAQQAVIQATNELEASAFDAQLIQMQAQVDLANARKQADQDILDRLGAQQGVIQATLDYETSKRAGALISAQQQLDIQDDQLQNLQRQLEIQQAVASVISTQVALANALKSALEQAGVIKDKQAESSSKSKSSSSSKKKKKALGGPVDEDDLVLVGEMGPEMFVPPEDGYILNNATTTRLMSMMGGEVDLAMARGDSTARQRQVGGTVMRGRSYMTGESGPEIYASPLDRQANYYGGGGIKTQRIYNVSVEYHAHQPMMGEARVDRVVHEAVEYASNTG